MKILLLLFVLVTCNNLGLASVEPVRNTKQGNSKNIIKRKKYKPVGASEKQYGLKVDVQSTGIPTYKDYKVMRSNEKDIAFPSNKNKWPRQKLTKNNEWKRNDNMKTSKEKGSKEWKRSNNNMWKNSKEVSSFGEKIQGPVVAQEKLKINSNMIKVHTNGNKIARVGHNGERPGQNKEVVGLNNVPHHDKSKRIWEIEKRAKSDFPNLKKMDEGTDNIKKHWADNKSKNGKENSPSVMGPKQKGATNSQDLNMDLLRKGLEDEALQKLRDLDKKILELQAADLLFKEKEEKTINTISNPSTSNQSSNFYVAWIHAATTYMKDFLNSF